MNLGPVIKLDKKNTTISKKKTMRLSRKIVASLLFFQSIAIFEPFGSRFPDAWSVILYVSSIVTFYLTKTESRTKKCVKIKGITIFVKNC